MATKSLILPAGPYQRALLYREPFGGVVRPGLMRVNQYSTLARGLYAGFLVSDSLNWLWNPVSGTRYHKTVTGSPPHGLDYDGHGNYGVSWGYSFSPSLWYDDSVAYPTPLGKDLDELTIAFRFWHLSATRYPRVCIDTNTGSIVVPGAGYMSFRYYDSSNTVYTECTFNKPNYQWTNFMAVWRRDVGGTGGGTWEGYLNGIPQTVTPSTGGGYAGEKVSFESFRIFSASSGVNNGGIKLAWLFAWNRALSPSEAKQVGGYGLHDLLVPEAGMSGMPTILQDKTVAGGGAIGPQICLINT